MSAINKLIVSVVTFTIAVIVAAEELPKLLGPAAIIFAMLVVARLVWFHTQRW